MAKKGQKFQAFDQTFKLQAAKRKQRGRFSLLPSSFYAKIKKKDNGVKPDVKERKEEK